MQTPTKKTMFCSDGAKNVPNTRLKVRRFKFNTRTKVQPNKVEASERQIFLCVTFITSKVSLRPCQSYQGVINTFFPFITYLAAPISPRGRLATCDITEGPFQSAIITSWSRLDYGKSFVACISAFPQPGAMLAAWM